MKMDKKKVGMIGGIGSLAAFLIYLFYPLIFPVSFQPLTGKAVSRNVTPKPRSSENLIFRVKEWKYPMKAQVQKKNKSKTYLGVSTSTNKMNFGIIPKGAVVTKFLNITSPAGKKTKIKLEGKGKIGKKLEIGQNFFYLNGERKQVRISFNGSEIGNYSGSLAIKSITSKNSLFDPLLKFA